MGLKEDFAKKNTVPAIEQVSKNGLFQIKMKDSSNMRILFVGNSITCHEEKPEIGWYGSWGMAASSRERDYVHQTVSMLEDKYENVSFGIAQLARWELTFDEECEHWKTDYQEVIDFNADIVVIRMGENIPEPQIAYAKNYIKDMIAFFGNGCKQVVVTDCFWKREPLDNLLREICEEESYTFCCISDLQNDTRTMALDEYEHEGVAIHPSDYGMKLIAERISGKIKGKEKLLK